MSDYLLYSGYHVYWYAGGQPREAFKATSGLAFASPSGAFDFRRPSYQCVKDAGPVPEGKYYLNLAIDRKHPYATDDGSNSCNLAASRFIQKIPRGGDPTAAPGGGTAGKCEPYWANWGRNRVRSEPADNKTRGACGGKRSGFYLHDSTKGYSHGCIEVEGRFFVKLYAYAKNHPQRPRLHLLVRYTGDTTYGGTDVF